MLNEDGLLLLLLLVACGLVALGTLELLWPTRPRHPRRRPLLARDLARRSSSRVVPSRLSRLPRPTSSTDVPASSAPAGTWLDVGTSPAVSQPPASPSTAPPPSPGTDTVAVPPRDAPAAAGTGPTERPSTGAGAPAASAPTTVTPTVAPPEGGMPGAGAPSTAIPETAPASTPPAGDTGRAAAPDPTPAAPRPPAPAPSDAASSVTPPRTVVASPATETAAAASATETLTSAAATEPRPGGEATPPRRTRRESTGRSSSTAARGASAARAEIPAGPESLPGEVATSGLSVVDRGFALLKSQRFDEVVASAQDALRAMKSTGPTVPGAASAQGAAKLWGLTGLAKQGLDDEEGARFAFEEAIALASGAERQTWEGHLVTLTLAVGRRALERSRRTPPADRVASLTSAVAWLERGLAIAPSDPALREVTASARDAVWGAHEAVVNDLLQRRALTEARRMLEDVIADPECPPERRLAFLRLLDGVNADAPRP